MRSVKPAVYLITILGLAAAGPASRALHAQVPKVTAGEVVDQETLKGFVTWATSVFADVTDINEGAQLVQAMREEGSDWNVGNMYLILFTTEGQVFIHGEKPHFDGSNVFELEDDRGSKVVQQMLAAADDGGFVEWCWNDPDDPNDPRCKDSYALGYTSQVVALDLVVVGGYYQDLSGIEPPLPPIPLPELSAADVVDRETLRGFVGGSVDWLRELFDYVGLNSTRWKTSMREEGGHWKSGPIYLFVLTTEGYVIFHGGNPFLEGVTVWDLEDLNGMKFAQDLIGVARAGGGFVEYFYDDPSVAGDEDTGSPKVSYALSLSDHPLYPGTEFIVGAGFYLNFSTAEAEAAAADWLDRFGRTVASQAMEMIGDRVTNAEGSDNQMTVNGQNLDFNSMNSLQGLLGAGIRRAALGTPGAFLPMSAGGLLGGTSFRFSPASAANGGIGYGFWGSGELMRFSSKGGRASGDGEVLTGALGADIEKGSMLAGLAVSYSQGSGGFEVGRAGADDAGELKATLTSAFPYARLAVSDRVSVWGVAGVGTGQLDLSGGGEEDPTSNISMRMGGIGARGRLLGGEGRGAFEFALRTDGFMARMKSEAVEGRSELSTNVSRLRLMLEAATGMSLGSRAMLEPEVRVGMRRDGGDVDSGFGMEVEGYLSFATTEQGLSVSLHGRRLVVHEQSGYEEWGVGGSIQLNPGGVGRGLSLGLKPSLGSTVSSLTRLWANGANGLTPTGYGYGNGNRRLDAEIGYGVDALDGRGVFAPYARLVLMDQQAPGRFGSDWMSSPGALVQQQTSNWSTRGFHVGGRLNLGSGLVANVEGGRSAFAPDVGATHSVMLNFSMHW